MDTYDKHCEERSHQSPHDRCKVIRTNKDKDGFFENSFLQKKLGYLPKNGNVSATTKVERTKIVLRNIVTPLDLIFSEDGKSSSTLSTIGVRDNAYLVIGVMT